MRILGCIFLRNVNFLGGSWYTEHLYFCIIFLAVYICISISNFSPRSIYLCMYLVTEEIKSSLFNKIIIFIYISEIAEHTKSTSWLIKSLFQKLYIYRIICIHIIYNDFLNPAINKIINITFRSKFILLLIRIDWRNKELIIKVIIIIRNYYWNIYIYYIIHYELKTNSYYIKSSKI